MSLSKITAHDQNEARSRSSSTSLTMMSACPTRSMIEREWVTVPASCEVSTGILDGPLWRQSGRKHEDEAQLWRARLSRGFTCERCPQRARQAARPAIAADAGDEHLEIGEQLAAAPYPLVQGERRGAGLDERGIDDQRVFEARRRQVLDRAAPHREADAVLGGELTVREAQAAQHLAAAALGKFEVVGVIDHAGRVGVLVIHPQRKAVADAVVKADAHGNASPAGTSGESSSNCPGVLTGTGKSRWRKAISVSTRPREVRCTKPSCIR